MTDLGTLGGPSSFASAINNASQVVGQSTISSSSPTLHGFLYSDGGMTDLGAFQPYGINDSGKIVGSAEVGGSQHAFVYSNGMMIDLNSVLVTSLPDTALNAALGTGINNAGQIVVQPILTGGVEAFLLKPVAVPEPVSFALTASGLFVLALVYKWKRTSGPLAKKADAARRMF